MMNQLVWIRVTSHRSRDRMVSTLGYRPHAYGLAPQWINGTPEYVGNKGEYYQVPETRAADLRRIKGITFPKRLDAERLRMYWQ